MSWWKSLTDTTQGIVDQAKQAQQSINKELQLNKTFQSFNKENILDQINKATANINKSFRENVNLEQLKGLIGEPGKISSELPSEREQLQFGVSNELVQFINTTQLYRVFRDFQQKEPGQDDSQNSNQDHILENQKQGSFADNVQNQSDNNFQTQPEETTQYKSDSSQHKSDDNQQLGGASSNGVEQDQQGVVKAEGQQSSKSQSYTLEPWQVTHARIILQRCPDLDYVRYMLCPRKMEEPLFWNIYFQFSKAHCEEAKQQYEQYIEQVKQAQQQNKAQQNNQQLRQADHIDNSNNQDSSKSNGDSTKNINQEAGQSANSQQVHKQDNNGEGSDQNGVEKKEQEDTQNEQGDEDYENWEEDLDDDPELREILKGVLKDQDNSKNGQDKESSQEEEPYLNEEEMKHYINQDKQ